MIVREIIIGLFIVFFYYYTFAENLFMGFVKDKQ